MGINEHSFRKGESKNGRFVAALGAMTISFKREIGPFGRYEIWTRVLSWDERWIYMVSHFVKAGFIRPRVFSDMPWMNKSAGKAKKLGKDKPVLGRPFRLVSF